MIEVGVRPAEGDGRFAEAVRQAVLAEQLGFDSVWLGEHHTAGTYWWPAPLMMLAAMASRTERIRLGSNVLITPLYHPLQLAESLAMLDGMSGGRVVAGLGAGYDPEEFAAFGVPLGERLARLHDTLNILRLAWGEREVRYRGRVWTVEGYRPGLYPVQGVRLPIWIGGWADRTLTMAAASDCLWVAGPTASLGQLAERYRVYAAAGARPMALVREVVIAERAESAWALAERWLFDKYQTYVRRGHPYVQYRDREGFRAFAEERFIIGDAAGSRSALAAYARALPVAHWILKPFHSGMSANETESALRRLAAEVVPALRAPPG